MSLDLILQQVLFSFSHRFVRREDKLVGRHINYLEHKCKAGCVVMMLRCVIGGGKVETLPLGCHSQVQLYICTSVTSTPLSPTGM